MNIINSKARKPVVILSAELSNSNAIINKQKTSSLKGLLERSGLPFKPVEGCYKDSKEVSFVVEVENRDEIRLVQDFSKLYGQESFLLIDESRDVTLIFNADESENRSLGKFVAVGKAEALVEDSYTYCVETDTYFVCRF